MLSPPLVALTVFVVRMLCAVRDLKKFRFAGQRGDGKLCRGILQYCTSKVKVTVQYDVRTRISCFQVMRRQHQPQAQDCWTVDLYF